MIWCSYLDPKNTACVGFRVLGFLFEHGNIIRLFNNWSTFFYRCCGFCGLDGLFHDPAFVRDPVAREAGLCLFLHRSHLLHGTLIPLPHAVLQQRQKDREALRKVSSHTLFNIARGPIAKFKKFSFTMLYSFYDTKLHKGLRRIDVSDRYYSTVGMSGVLESPRYT